MISLNFSPCPDAIGAVEKLLVGCRDPSGGASSVRGLKTGAAMRPVTERSVRGVSATAESHSGSVLVDREFDPFGIHNPESPLNDQWSVVSESYANWFHGD